GSNHYIGAACDIQTGWNRGPEFVYHMSDIVKQAGLYDGCTFRDCGHVEALRGTHNRAPNLYAAMEKFKSEQSTANYQPSAPTVSALWLDSSVVVAMTAAREKVGQTKGRRRP